MRAPHSLVTVHGWGLGWLGLYGGDGGPAQRQPGGTTGGTVYQCARLMTQTEAAMIRPPTMLGAVTVSPRRSAPRTSATRGPRETQAATRPAPPSARARL